MIARKVNILKYINFLSYIIDIYQFKIINIFYNFIVFNRNELLTTDTLESAIARPANIGFKSQPNNG